MKTDISVEDGKLIVAEAASWKGTPYDTRGARSIKGVIGDCSGSTYEIYQAANFPYAYQITGTFLVYARSSGLFRELGVDEQRQDGGILLWPGHMAIYSSFSSDPLNAVTVRTSARNGSTWAQRNDMWPAFHKDGPPYGPADSHQFRPDPPLVLRYQR